MRMAPTIDHSFTRTHTRMKRCSKYLHCFEHTKKEEEEMRSAQNSKETLRKIYIKYICACECVLLLLPCI